MSRDKALSELAKPLYSGNELAEDKAFVAKKLGIDLRQLDQFVTEAPRHYTAFPTNAWQVKWGLRAFSVVRSVGRAAGEAVKRALKRSS
jgi:hypothetical protein